MEIDSYLRACRGVPAIPERWRWSVIRQLSGIYEISIIDEDDVVLSSQEYVPQGLNYDDSDFLTTVKGTYFFLYRNEYPEFSEVRHITSR